MGDTGNGCNGRVVTFKWLIGAILTILIPVMGATIGAAATLGSQGERIKTNTKAIVRMADQIDEIHAAIIGGVCGGKATDGRSAPDN